MFREMRRKNQKLSQEVCERILHRATSGVLAVSGDDGYPYAVPLSFAFADGCLYFHVAKSGHKLDALRRNPKASFCIIDQDQVVPQEYTTYFRSVIAFGSVRILEKEEDTRRGLDHLANKYCTNETRESREREIGALSKALYVVEMRIAHLTGKQAKELVEERTRCAPTEKKTSAKG